MPQNAIGGPQECLFAAKRNISGISFPKILITAFYSLADLPPRKFLSEICCMPPPAIRPVYLKVKVINWKDAE